MRANSILEALQQGILICDRHTRIVYMNEAYSSFIGYSLEEVKGKKITKYRESAKVPEVIKTGIPIDGMLRREEDKEYFASVYPIIEENEIRGSISIVTSIANQQLKLQLQHNSLAERVSKFEKQEIEATICYYGGGVEGKKKAAQELGISLATLYNKIK